MSTQILSPPDILISDRAKTHFLSLIEKEDVPGMALRIFLEPPHHVHSEVSIAFCPPGEHRAGDRLMKAGELTLYIDNKSAPYLESAEIDYKEDKLGGQLAIKVPNLKNASPPDDAAIADRVNYLLETQINPGLASHGGMVSLIEITNENDVVLRFGGGCHGCGMVDVTLKQGIEKTLMEQLPEVRAVIDVTDHSAGENPYYT